MDVGLENALAANLVHKLYQQLQAQNQRMKALEEQLAASATLSSAYNAAHSNRLAFDHKAL